MASLQSIIKRSPSVIQKLYYNVVPFSKRYGKVFNDTYKFLLESEHWTKEQLKKYQLQEFKKLINHCYNNVPYYTKVFNDRELTPNDFQSFGVLKGKGTQRLQINGFSLFALYMLFSNGATLKVFIVGIGNLLSFI